MNNQNMVRRMAVTALSSMLPLVGAFAAPTSLLPAASKLSTIRSFCLRPGLRAEPMHDGHEMDMHIDNLNFLRGKRGATMQSFFGKNGARISVRYPFKLHRSSMQTVVIYGTAKGVEMAKEVIAVYLTTENLSIPAHQANLIGKWGATIKAIENDTGARVNRDIEYVEHSPPPAAALAVPPLPLRVDSYSSPLRYACL